MRGRRIRLRGTGPAALVLAKLLLDRWAEVVIDAPVSRKRRVVSIPMETVALAAHLFEIELDQLTTGCMVRERRVDWSGDGPAVMPDSALVCDIGDFCTVLARSLRGATIAGAVEDEDADWIIDATGRPAAAGLHGGERVGYSARIADAAPESFTSITATADGWIFTSPHVDGGLAVLLVAPSLSTADPTVEGIADRLARAGRSVASGAVIDISRPELLAPRLSTSLWDSNQLAAGDAAFALDPLRGDGIGFALRGALLAQAVVAAIENGQDRSRCMAHYEERIYGAFAGHLRGCCAHYRAARSPLIWSRDVTAMEELAKRLDRGAGTLAFRLAGVDLVPFSSSGAAGSQPAEIPRDTGGLRARRSTLGGRRVIQ